MTELTVVKADRVRVNRYMLKWHYLHKPVIRTKMLGYYVKVDGKVVGAMLWATPQFTKKRGLFGFRNRLDKWEVLTLARFYLSPVAANYGITASWFFAEVIGRAGRKSRSHKRGWRIQEDWVREWPPVFPQNPYVPRLLMSWSDAGTLTVENCARCGQTHTGHHTGTIYQAAGWRRWDETTSAFFRTEYTEPKFIQQRDGALPKTCWILRLPVNGRAWQLGQDLTVNREKSALTIAEQSASVGDA